MKTFVYILIGLVILVGGFFALNSYIYNEKQGDGTNIASSTPETPTNTDDVIKGEMGENPEGEANPDIMTLGMNKWRWISAKSGAVTVTPKKADAFTLTFKTDGTFSATTDCNSVGGSYRTSGKEIIFEKIYSTKMYCEGSQEEDFQKFLSSATSYSFTNRGELIFALPTGTMTFR